MHLRKSAHFRQGNIPIIKFFGSYHFEGDDTFYILLEYATGGTLEHMFERGERPKSLHDILSFWERLLKLVNALNMIHVVRLHEPDEERIIQGYVLSPRLPSSGREMLNRELKFSSGCQI